jgi:predicted phosphodiesterase
MRIAISSDVHAVMPAWQAFVDDAQVQGVDAYWFLGDVVGYGPYPIEVAQAVQACIEGNDRSVYLLGNHDALASKDEEQMPRGLIPGTGLTRSGINHEAELLTLSHGRFLKKRAPQELAWLEQKTETQANPAPGIFLAHGSYVDPALHDMKFNNDARWLYPTANHNLASAQAADIERWHADEGGLRAVFYGHYHVPALLRYQPNSYTITPDAIRFGEWITLENLAETRAIINVGSLAMPRDGAGVSSEYLTTSYVLVDLPDEMTAPPNRLRIQFRRNPYDWCGLVNNTSQFADLMRQEIIGQIKNSPLPDGVSCE